MTRFLERLRKLGREKGEHYEKDEKGGQFFA